MTRIDQYILFLFLRVFFICLTCLTGLIVIVDLFTNLDDLIEAAKDDQGLTILLVSYYGPFSLSLFTRLCPFFALMALLFSVSWLKRTNELTALMAAGIPKGRALRFPIIATVVLVLVSATLRETVLPLHQHTLGKRPQDLTGENLRPLRPALDPQTGILIGGHHIEILNQQIIRPIFRLSGPAAKYGRQISAELAAYQTATDQHADGYLVTGVTAPQTLVTVPSIVLDRKPIILTPVDNPWLAPNQCFVVSSVQFILLQGGSSWGQYDSTLNIVKRLHAQPTFYGPDVHVKVHARFVQPILDITLVLFGLPVVLKRVDRHLFWIASAVTWSIIFFTAFVVGIQTLASHSSLLSPFMGAWLPLLALTPLAYAKARTAMLS